MAQTVDLPVVLHSASLRTALSKMKKHGRSGLVVKRGLHYFLYTARDVRAGLYEDLKSVSDLEPKYKSVTIRFESPKRSEAKSLATYMKKSLAKASAKQFFVLDSSASEATIAVPRKQFFIALRSSPPNCHCTGPRRHDEFPTAVSSGDDCPHCGKKITCDD